LRALQAQLGAIVVGIKRSGHVADINRYPRAIRLIKIQLAQRKAVQRQADRQLGHLKRLGFRLLRPWRGDIDPHRIRGQVGDTQAALTQLAPPHPQIESIYAHPSIPGQRHVERCHAQAIPDRASNPLNLCVQLPRSRFERPARAG
jgi:hypothetical protein